MISTTTIHSLVARIRKRLGLSADPRRPSRALFSGIRRRLTLWYTAILAAALIVSGIVLYFAVQQQLLGPVNNLLAQYAAPGVTEWQVIHEEKQAGLLAHYPCDSAAQVIKQIEPSALVSCYGPKGGQIGFSTYNPALRHFTNSGLARSVTGGGSATDTVSTGLSYDFSSIQRYAIAVPNPDGTGFLGVLQVGVPVGGQANALATLLNLLLLLGVLTILFSLGAGLFLASRALQPARIAYARQRDFIADASHELRTPLTMLRSTVEFVLRGKDHLSVDDVALLEDTVQETTHLTQLANNMLDLARLDSDSFHIDEEVVDLGEVAKEVARWAAALARERDVTVAVLAPDQVLVFGDGSLLQQAVLVLVDNAVKYNRPQGQVDITVRRIGSDAVMEISDTGIGVAAEHLSRLGERFYRVDKARSRESGGAGLGLSIVRSVIARHNGSFNLTSEPGKGTIASIHLACIADHDIRMFDEDVAADISSESITPSS